MASVPQCARARLSEAIRGLADAELPAGERKALARHAVALCVQGPGSDGPARPRPPCADLELAMAEVGKFAGDRIQVKGIGNASAVLKKVGLAGLAARLSKLSARRKLAAHPDAPFLEALREGLAAVPPHEKQQALAAFSANRNESEPESNPEKEATALHDDGSGDSAAEQEEAEAASSGDVGEQLLEKVAGLEKMIVSLCDVVKSLEEKIVEFAAPNKEGVPSRSIDKEASGGPPGRETVEGEAPGRPRDPERGREGDGLPEHKTVDGTDEGAPAPGSKSEGVPLLWAGWMCGVPSPSRGPPPAG